VLERVVLQQAATTILRQEVEVEELYHLQIAFL
jgi:hypothetical protein